MGAIARQQAQVREAMQQTMGTLLPPGLEEMRRQNVAMMERAMSLFTPFCRPGEEEPAGPDASDELRALREEVQDLRAKLGSATRERKT